MKFSTQEEYGLRCLLQIAKHKSDRGLTIPEISELEGLTVPNVAKLLRIMRIGGLVESERGQIGGYKLSRPANEISLQDVVNVLGGRLFEDEFCNSHSGAIDICTNSIDCSIRSVWKTVQKVVDEVLGKLTLKDLLGSEEEVDSLVTDKFEASGNSNPLKILS
ncbi:MAG: Rrf2 family transcriptional regulator [Ignavibacteria bacterium]|nr:Rrf2 family transcriptional regulator [Ignavibacteria bacterium]